MRDSLTIQRNVVAPMNHSNNGGLYSSMNASSNGVSDFITSGNPTSTADSSTVTSHAIIDSGLHDNLFLHPEVHNLVHQPHSGRHSDHRKAKSHNLNGNYSGGMSVFGQVTIEVTGDELISDGVAMTRLCSLLSPLIFLMACVGLYHPSSEDVTPERDSCFSGAWFVRFLLILWSIIVGLFLLFNLVAIGFYVDVYHGLAVLNVTELVIVIRLLKALVILCLFFAVFESSERYEEMLEKWCIWLRWQTEKNTSHSRRWILMITCLTLLSAAVPSVLAGLSVFGYIPDMGLQQTAFATDRLNDNLPEWHQELRVTFTVAISVANLIISLFCGFFGSICNILSYEMRLLSREIQVEVRGQAVIWDMKIEPLSGQEVTVMEFLRRKHGKIVGVVQAVDQSFREMLFFHYAFSIPMVIFEIYLLLIAAPIGAIGFKGTIILFAILALWEMFTVWLSAVNVHNWAHQPTKILPTIDIHEKKEISHAHQTSLQFFMTSLTTEKIAMTLWGIVPLTKEFIIGVIVFVVTYLIILRDLNGSHILSQAASIAITKPLDLPNVLTTSHPFLMGSPAVRNHMMLGGNGPQHPMEELMGNLTGLFLHNLRDINTLSSANQTSEQVPDTNFNEMQTAISTRKEDWSDALSNTTVHVAL